MIIYRRGIIGIKVSYQTGGSITELANKRLVTVFQFLFFFFNFCTRLV